MLVKWSVTKTKPESHQRHLKIAFQLLLIASEGFLMVSFALFGITVYSFASLLVFMVVAMWSQDVQDNM
jgi:hypothetical protein